MDIHDDPFAGMSPEEADVFLKKGLAEIEAKYADTPEPMLRGLSDEVKEEFRQLADSKDMIEHWYPSINPKVVGMEDVKRAVLLSIASHGDKFGDRGRLHVLMHGDPGTAKSMITDWLVFHQGAVGASMRTSRVGLTADASGAELVLGALPKANDSISCLDELDKFDQKSLQGLLEALERGGDSHRCRKDTRDP